MGPLRGMGIFQLRPYITKFRAKLSTATEYDPQKQIICLVSDDNEILLRYTTDAGADVLKLISWFKKSSRVVHDVCFDPTGTWLLVLCFDNTLHVVPALSIVDTSCNLENAPFTTSEITSFVIPFVGPHECPNSKSCPNVDSNTVTFTSSSERLAENTFDHTSRKNANNEYRFSPNLLPAPITTEEADTQDVPYKILESLRKDSSTEESPVKSHTKLSNRQDTEGEAGSSTDRSNLTNNESVESFMSSATCPYPLCVTWWQALDQRNRAIIGYSDGSLCFVGLTPNCPFVSTSNIENGSVVKLTICKDNSMQNVTLLINSSNRDQWKLLLEQKSINYTFPGDGPPTPGNDNGKDDWQIVTPIRSDNSDRWSNSQGDEVPKDNSEGSNQSSPAPIQLEPSESPTGSRLGILPAARARLALLKDGAKKFIAMKMKLTDPNKFKTGESNSDDSLSSFAIMESPTMTPEILTTPSGPYFIVQNLRNTFLLSALHTYSDTLSVHRMDVSLIPVFLYKIPSHCQEVLICSNILYSTQMIDTDDPNPNDRKNEPENSPTNAIEGELKSSVKDQREEISEKDQKRVNGVGVISSAMASIKNGEEVGFNENSLLGLFPFPDETIISVHRIVSFPTQGKQNIIKDMSNGRLDTFDLKSPGSYVNLHRKLQCDDIFPLRESDFMLSDFPNINYDPCLVVTNKNTYTIELNNEPHVIFLNAAIAGAWTVCEDFCNTFDLSFSQCIEFAGDLLLRRKKITQALFTYNIGRIPPVRTALKLAMFGENFALMQLCALALKSTNILKSKHASHRLIKYIMLEADKRHCENLSSLLKSDELTDADSEAMNEGKICSDYIYGADDISNNLQMSASSQFHLSNLLLMTLAEKTVRDKNYFPIWNFLVSNLKFHTNMTSIVLCQSGLYSSALLLAMVRGVSLDVFTGMVSVLNQEFGWYSELNVLLYNLSEFVFRETITYLPYVSFDYLNIIQSKLHKIEDNVLQRLEQQLNPFLAVYRPIVSQYSSRSGEDASGESYGEMLEFCKIFIETYLAICIQIETHKMRQSNFTYALYNFRINYEDNQFAIKSANFPPLSAGWSHCACVIDGLAYFWGSNGVPCIYSINKFSDPLDPPHVVKCLEVFSQLNVEVHAVKCGRQHSLILTNNGLYSQGMNQLGQLGVGKTIQAALQPVLIEALDDKNITLMEAGQYHNAVVADKKLYTWGWGIYGQLGHGNVENAYEPKVVSFFDRKNLLQISLGHAHSIVLCDDIDGERKVFVFGSNHYGQLGVGAANENKSSPNKCLLPVKLVVGNDSPIRLIHTKFFISFALNDRNELYTWGASPQALRLANQVKKRANAKSKIEESFKREINRRNEQILKDDTASMTRPPPPSPPREICIPVPTGTKSCTHPEMPKSNSDGNLTSETMKIINESDNRRRNSEPNCRVDEIPTTTWNFDNMASSSNFEEDSADTVNVEEKVIDSEATPVDSAVPRCESEDLIVIEDVPPVEPSTSSKEEKLSSVRSCYIEEEIGDHMVPHKVDTSEVSGEILQVSSGLFHSAIISSTSLLYTWGKNLEHQLGTEDKDRRTVIKPFAVESIENPMYVECGTDFTLVLTTDYIVKAFGGNASGQCGRDLGPPPDKNKPGKLFYLPSAKRLMRLEGQCVESPCDINLPRPRIQMGSEPTRYLKSFPKFKSKYIMRPSLGSWFESSNSLMQSDCYQESEDFASSIENLSLNDDDSLCSVTLRMINLSSNENSPINEIAACPPVFHHSKASFRGHKHHFSYTNKAVASRTGDISFRHYIHYCLYIFHGLYGSQRVCELAQDNLEFRIRILMLNYKYVDAFTLCVGECKSAQTSIRIFEYFTKDPSIVPMRQKDLKFFIHQLFIHFITKSLDLSVCEEFFISDLDYYLLELAYVLYFNNNNTELEQSMNHKFKVLLEQDATENLDYNLGDTDVIFDSLSVRFKALVCQGLLRMCEN